MMKAPKNVVEVLDPVPGPVQPVAGKIVVKVHAKGTSPVISVKAEAYRQHPPANPEYPLSPGNTPHVFEGKISVFPAGEFGIKVTAKFAGEPAQEESVEVGPYMVPLSAGGDQVEIKDPDPGHVMAGEGAEFNVLVFAQGLSSVDEVRAGTYSSGGSAPGWGGLSVSLNPHASLADHYEGILFGLGGNFRIRAMAKFLGGSDPPPPMDDKGDYSL